MVARIISHQLIHVWVPAGFFVIRLRATTEHVVAATTCAMGTQNWVWLASACGFTRRLHLIESASDSCCIDLDPDFFSPMCNVHTAVQSDCSVSLDVGDVLFMTTFGEHKSHEGGSSRCHCNIEVFGRRGYMRLDAGTGAVIESDGWQSETDAVAVACGVESGPLRQAIVPRGFASPALVTIGLGGLVRASYGLSYSSVCKRSKWKKGGCDVLDLFQQPVFQASDPGHHLLVIVGCFRAGVILYADTEGNLASQRFVLRGGVDPLKQGSLLMSTERDSLIVIEEVTTGHRAGFKWDKNSHGVVVDLDWDKRLLQRRNYQNEDYSQTLRTLLRGIEDLGETERGHEADCKSAEGSLASYNAALLFVSAYKAKERDETVKAIAMNSCKVRVRATSSDSCIQLQRPDLLLGRDAFITVSFENQVGVSLNDGWRLRLLLRKNVGNADSSTNALFSVQGNRETGIYSAETQRIMMCPLQRVPPGEEKLVSFPVTIDSHAPLLVSVFLCFCHPVPLALRDSPVDVSITLCENLTLDILDMSKPASVVDIKDSSHDMLASSQLMSMFSVGMVDNPREYPVMSRFDLPISVGDAMRILELKESFGSFETLLGAQFAIRVEATLHPNTKESGVRFQASTVTIRGVSHVIPFVRAAILRRILATAGREAGLLTKMVVRERANIIQWRKSLRDSVDNSLPSFRKAEEQLVEALRVFDEIGKAGRIELCFDGREKDAIAASLQKIRGSYGVWRRQNERLWVPSNVDASSVTNW